MFELSEDAAVFFKKAGGTDPFMRFAVYAFLSCFAFLLCLYDWTSYVFHIILPEMSLNF